MRRFKHAVLIIVLAATAVAAEGAEPKFRPAPGQEPVVGRYVVTLDVSVAADLASASAEALARAYGGQLEPFASGDARQFAIAMLPARARALSVDARVQNVVGIAQEADDALAPPPSSPAANGSRHLVPVTRDSSSTGTYLYDGSGNIKAIGADTFFYDGELRLKQAIVQGSQQNYEYDPFGNRKSSVRATGAAGCVGGCDLPVTPDQHTNHVAEASYDEAGNVLSMNGATYSYDGTGMVTGATVGSDHRDFIYTADDERIAVRQRASWTWSVRDQGGKVLREFTSLETSASPLTLNQHTWSKDYVWRDGLLLASVIPAGSGTATYHYHLDHIGTPRLVTDQNHILIGRHTYYPFGAEMDVTPHENAVELMKFTGHERDIVASDNNSVDYMHARFYNSSGGRFLSVDPVMGDPHAPQSWNRYAYVHNNPVNLTDPTGRCTFIPCLNYGRGAFDLVENITVTAQAPPEPSTFQEQFINEMDIQLGEQMRTDWANTSAGRAEFSGAPNIAANGGEFMMVAPFTGMLRGVGADVVTSAGSRVFWSGSQGAGEAAASFAQANGATTLEMTATGQALTRATATAGWEATQGAWSAASRSFAEGASGDVTVFQAATGVRVGGMWATQEYPMLVGNSSVTGIRYMIVYPNGTVIPVP